jgi:hypothetical protein
MVVKMLIQVMASVVKMSEQKVRGRGVRGVRILAMSRIFPHGRDLGILIVTTP